VLFNETTFTVLYIRRFSILLNNIVFFKSRDILVPLPRDSRSYVIKIEFNCTWDNSPKNSQLRLAAYLFRKNEADYTKVGTTMWRAPLNTPCWPVSSCIG
jgi:hypothetical protein